jgi:Methyltransferase domain
MYNVNQSIRKRPFTFIKEALNSLKTNNPIIVEVGSMRKPCTHPLDEYNHECCNDGHSSLLLARAAKEFHTVDIDVECSKLTLKELKTHNLNKQSFVYNGDGIKFLKDFDKKIDLLYLDAWDVELPNHAEMHLEAFKVAEDKLNDVAIILIDDTDIGFTPEKGFHNDEEALGGKGRLLIPYLLNKGYKLLFKGRQVGFIKQ